MQRLRSSPAFLGTDRGRPFTQRVRRERGEESPAHPLGGAAGGGRTRGGGVVSVLVFFFGVNDKTFFDFLLLLFLNYSE